MAAELSSDLVKTVALLAAGVVAVPLFKRLGLGSVLGYLAAGLAIGPFGLGLFEHPETILHVAELGVVMFLFVIGLEMQPSRLWKLRKQIFGLGVAQVAVCGTLLTVAGMLLWDLPVERAFVGAMGFVLSSTAIVMQMLDERGETATPRGQRIVSVLLLEDMSIVPLLALVAFLAPAGSAGDESRWLTIGIALAAVLGLVAVSRWLLNPLFRLLARFDAREVMTAAALLVVLGSALLMQWGGLSMALGAFAAGVMLSESSFRHQLEADVEPFRGLLLGLFFMGVGMSLDLALVRDNLGMLLMGVTSYMVIKSAGIYAVARATRSGHAEALERAGLMAQGGEFAFVLYAAAAAVGVLSARANALLTAAIILSMAFTPPWLALLRRLAPGGSATDFTDVEHAANATPGEGSVLIIGFGRVGQIVSQVLLARGVPVSIIDTDTDMIRAAQRFGAKLYYGDGSRLDVLHASGAGHARAILVCVDKREATRHILERVKEAFPLVPVLVRAFDRQAAIELVREGADFQVRETFESALRLGEAALRQIGLPEDEAASVIAHVRQLDTERFEAELLGNEPPEIIARNFLRKRWEPTPLTNTAQPGLALDAATAEVLAGDNPAPPAGQPPAA
jgi:glutathione-regulated potassium-efflux system protein KefB